MGEHNARRNSADETRLSGANPQSQKAKQSRMEVEIDQA
jgi:hypothetical protein